MTNRKVVDPPSKLKLYQFLKEAIEGKRDANLLGFNRENIPDKEFMITLLFNLNKDHKIFQKSYIDEKKR